MNLNDIIENPNRQKIFDILLEEACRQWCECMNDAPERATGEGFARFFYDIFQDKEQEYMEDLGIISQEKQEKSSIRQALKQNQAELSAKSASAPDKGKKQETAL